MTPSPKNAVTRNVSGRGVFGVFPWNALEALLTLMLNLLIALAGILKLRGKVGEFFEDRSPRSWALTQARAKRFARERSQLASAEGTSAQGLPVYWFHVASAGELEQAIPIARSLAASPHCYFVLSYTSPSAKPFLKNFPNPEQTLAFALHPFQRSRVATVLETLTPDGVFFVRYDLWPTLIRVAHKHGTRLFLIAATRQLVRGGILTTLSAGIKRLLLSAFDHIFAITPKDAEFFESLVGPDRVTVAGEPKWARAKERAAHPVPPHSPVFALRRLTHLLRLVQRSPILLFGSPHKEEWSILRRLLSDPTLPERLTIIAAPHDVGPAEISRLRAQLSLPGVRVFRLSEAAAILGPDSKPSTGRGDSAMGTEDVPDVRSPLDALHTRSPRTEGDELPEALRTVADNHRILWLVDMMGFLAEAYSACDLAIIGGGFDGGLHNCLEPAAQGVPVVFGSRHTRAPEAQVLIDAGAARCFELPDELFQFLRHCVSVPASDSTPPSQPRGASLPQMAMNSSKLFESIPKTHEIIQTQLRTTMRDETLAKKS